MTIPDKGIRNVSLAIMVPAETQFFTSPKKKGRSESVTSRSHTPTPVDPEVIDLAQLDDDDEEEILEEGDFVPIGTEIESIGKRKRDHLLGPSCPICGTTLGPATSNQELNDHVDMCLNKDAIAAAGKATPKKVKRARPPAPPPESGTGMLQWLRKGQEDVP